MFETGTCWGGLELRSWGGLELRSRGGRICFLPVRSCFGLELWSRPCLFCGFLAFFIGGSAPSSALISVFAWSAAGSLGWLRFRGFDGGIELEAATVCTWSWMKASILFLLAIIFTEQTDFHRKTEFQKSAENVFFSLLVLVCLSLDLALSCFLGLFCSFFISLAP